jgi:hypothetical protein
MYKCVPTRAVCLSSAYCVHGTSELGVVRFESFSTIAVTNPKSPTLIWPSSEKNMFDGCKLKWDPCNVLETSLQSPQLPQINSQVNLHKDKK